MRLIQDKMKIDFDLHVNRHINRNETENECMTA
jgi:hypothetical protein